MKQHEAQFGKLCIWKHPGYAPGMYTIRVHHPKKTLLESSNLEKKTVEPPISNHQKCDDLVVVYRRWLLTIIDPHVACSQTLYFLCTG